jgi:hypothetical protein
MDTTKLLMGSSTGQTLSYSPISDHVYKLHLEDKKYVEYLIKNNIFQKSDIKKAFPTDIFEEFDKFKQAYKVYKKSHKE